MITVNYLYSSGREWRTVIADTDWYLLETLENSAMLKEFGIVGVEVVKYQPNH